MAYVSDELIKKVRAKCKEIDKKYGMKCTVRHKNRITLQVIVRSGKHDLKENMQATINAASATLKNPDGEYVSLHYLDDIRNLINEEVPYFGNFSYRSCTIFSGELKAYIDEIRAAMLEDHWDKSDIQTDCFHCAYYHNLYIGEWDKPYKVTK